MAAVSAVPGDSKCVKHMKMAVFDQGCNARLLVDHVKVIKHHASPPCVLGTKKFAFTVFGLRQGDLQMRTVAHNE